MKKIALLLVTVGYSATSAYAQIYMAKTCEISFFSKTPIEDIAAVNKTTKPMFNTATGDLQMKLGMTAFVFEKPLMQEHFNENYVESDKFPYAFFKGKINEKIDFTEDGKHKVTATGKMTIHGVEKDKTIEGFLTVDMNKIILSSEFKLDFTEYGVVIPALYSGVIPPVTDVKLNATLEPFKKN
jgi:polyisoprenoid-binding protein YceI